MTDHAIGENNGMNYKQLFAIVPIILGTIFLGFFGPTGSVAAYNERPEFQSEQGLRQSPPPRWPFNTRHKPPPNPPIHPYSKKDIPVKSYNIGYCDSCHNSNPNFDCRVVDRYFDSCRGSWVTQCCCYDKRNKCWVDLNYIETPR